MSQAGLAKVLGVVDAIYGAAQGDRSWQVALDGLRIVLGGARACIAEARDDGFVAASHEVNDDPRFSAAEAMTLYSADPLATAEQMVPVGRSYLWREIIDFPAFRRRRLWGEFYEPMGLHDSLSCRLADNGNTSLTLHVTRQSRQEVYARTDRRVFNFIVPHLVRAGSIERTIGRAAPATDALLQSPAGILIVDCDRRVHWMNVAAETILTSASAPFGLACGALSLERTEYGQAIGRLVAEVCTDAGTSPGGTLLLKPGDDNQSFAGRFVLQVAPLASTSAFGVPSARRAMITVKPVVSSRSVDIEDALRKLFGLTRAEARLASLLVEDYSLRDSASRAGITFGTARNYLIRIFRKTGTDRQSALVRLAAALAGGEQLRP